MGIYPGSSIENLYLGQYEFTFTEKLTERVIAETEETSLLPLHDPGLG